MTVNAWPFAPPDRPWGAPEWRQFMVRMREGGVIADVDQECLVEPVAGELQSTVRTGMAFIAGHQVVVEADETVDHDTADLSNDRVDLVVLTADWTSAERRAYAEVVTGTPASSPSAPSPTQDDVGDPEGVWQEPLFEVLVEAAAGETGGHTDVRTFMETPGRVIVVDAEGDLSSIDPTFHRFAVVHPSGGDAASAWYYDTDADQWEQIVGSGATTVSELEDATVGDTAPSSPSTDDLWYDTSTNVWKRWDGSAWQPSGNATYQPNDLYIERSSKDSEGVFTVIEWFRKDDNSRYMRSELSGGTSPEYDQRTVTWYEADGSTTRDSVTYNLTYDSDGDLTSEAVA